MTTTERILKIYAALIELHMVRGPVEFVNKIGYHKVSWAQVQNGDREIPDIYYDKICTAFGVSKEYIFEGKGPMFVNKEKEKTIHVFGYKMRGNILEYTDIYGIKNKITFQQLT